MLAFRSLDPFRALREPDRRRRDEERPFPLRTKNCQRNPNNNHRSTAQPGQKPLDRKSPIQVLCEPLFNARQTGLDKQQAVQEKPALLACYREGINAHLMAEERPGGLFASAASLIVSATISGASPKQTHR